MIHILTGGNMEEQDNDNDYVLVFDHFYTNNHIQIMKTLLPYIDSAAMPMLPVMIKYLELQYTIKLVRKNTRPEAPVLSACSKDSPDIETIYQSIRKYRHQRRRKASSKSSNSCILWIMYVRCSK